MMTVASGMMTLPLLVALCSLYFYNVNAVEQTFIPEPLALYQLNEGSGSKLYGINDSNNNVGEIKYMYNNTTQRASVEALSWATDPIFGSVLQDWK